jgi:hypothetical protein
MIALSTSRSTVAASAATTSSTSTACRGSSISGGPR